MAFMLSIRADSEPMRQKGKVGEDGRWGGKKKKIPSNPVSFISGTVSIIE